MKNIKPLLIFFLIFLLGFLTAIGVFMLLAARMDKSEALPEKFLSASLDRPPVNGEWLVFWGGPRKDQNVHHGVPAQHLALDLVMTANKSEKTFRTDGKTNEDYYCWNQAVVAPLDGVVITAVDGIEDNIPGKMNPQMVYGNTIMIQHSNGFVSVYAHLRKGSIKVKEGYKIPAGQVLAHCGNSGNSSEPHLHFHVQSKPGFEQGVALNPIWKNIRINGAAKANHSPAKGEQISNTEE